VLVTGGISKVMRSYTWPFVTKWSTDRSLGYWHFGALWDTWYFDCATFSWIETLLIFLLVSSVKII